MTRFGRDDACEEAWIAAHHGWVRRSGAEGAARCAFGQALGLFFRGELAPAMGWVARGGRLLKDNRRDCVEQAWLLMLTALPRLFEGDADVVPSFVDAGEIAERFADPDASMFARLCRGYARLSARPSTYGTKTIAHASAASAASATSEKIMSAISPSQGRDRRTTVPTMTSGVHAVRYLTMI